jgi:hypothetical protein
MRLTTSRYIDGREKRVSTWIRIIVCLALGLLLVACGGSSDEPEATEVAESEETSVTEPDETPEASTEETPYYAFADYEFSEVSPKHCKKTQKLGQKTDVTIHAIKVPTTGFVYFEADCLTDVRSDQITVTLVNDTTEQHNFIVEGDDVELITLLGEKTSGEIELIDEPQLTFQCTYHPGMQGAFFR